MSEDAVKEDKKKKVIEKITQSVNPTKNDLLKIIDEVYQEDQKNHFLRLILIFVLMLTVSLLLADFLQKNFSLDSFDDLKTYLAFLAFVVALASYLASVSREIVKVLPSKSGDNRKKLKENLFYIVSAEIPLVFLGVLCVFRFNITYYIFEKLNLDIVNYDIFLISFLLVILLWMTTLHFRIWKNEEVYKY
ncbi:MAG: hypothetical protein ACXW1T_07630 [Methylophilus sp.]